MVRRSPSVIGSLPFVVGIGGWPSLLVVPVFGAARVVDGAPGGAALLGLGLSDASRARAYAPACATFRRIDAELQSVTPLCRAARERGGPLPSIDAAARLLYARARLPAGAI